MLCHVIVLMYPFSYSMDSCWWTAKTPLFFLASRCQSCLFAVLCVESTGFFLSCKDREIDTTGCLLPIFLILIVHITVGCSSVATNSLTCPLISIVASAAVPVSIFFQRLNELFLNQNGCYSARQGVTFDLIGRVFTLSSPYCCSHSLPSARLSFSLLNIPRPQSAGVFGVTTWFPDSLYAFTSLSPTCPISFFSEIFFFQPEPTIAATYLTMPAVDNKGLPHDATSVTPRSASSFIVGKVCRHSYYFFFSSPFCLLAPGNWVVCCRYQPPVSVGNGFVMRRR